MWKVGIGITAIGLFMLTAIADADARSRGAGVASPGGAFRGGAFRGASPGAFRGGVAPRSFARPAFRGGVAPRSFARPAFRGGIAPRSFARPAFRGGVAPRSFARPAFRGGVPRVAGRNTWRGQRFVAGQRAFRGNRVAAQRALRANPVLAGNRLNWRANRSALRANRALARQAGWYRHSYYRRHFIRPIARVAWLGPVFWPYAYNDFFYYTLWPYWYDDPFWDYGYTAIYDGIFAPGGYVDAPYVGPRRQVARRPGVSDDGNRPGDVTGSLGQLCGGEARDIAGWPIERIQRAVAPDDRQRALLDDLANAALKAGETVKAGCTTESALTPPGRLDTMEKRVDAMIKAVEIVRPPLESFYNALSDEQKARFNAMGEPGPRTVGRELQRAQPGALTACGADAQGLTAWPTEQVERIVQPNETQRAGLNALASAATKAADMLKAACPTDLPQTPVGRLDAAAKRLDVLSQAIRTVRAALGDFYSSLDDEQKARFNRIGDQLGRRRI
jgi:LTXXQ motif family protein